MFAQDQWFSAGTPASSTTKTGRHDIAEILLKVALNTKKIKFKFQTQAKLKILKLVLTAHQINRPKWMIMNVCYRYRICICFYDFSIRFGTVLKVWYYFMQYLRFIHETYTTYMARNHSEPLFCSRDHCARISEGSVNYFYLFTLLYTKMCIYCQKTTSWMTMMTMT